MHNARLGEKLQENAETGRLPGRIMTAGPPETQFRQPCGCGESLGGPSGAALSG